MPIVDPIALAQTYDHPTKDPWDAVELYREATKKPSNWGAQRVASAINSDQSNEFEGISRSEVRAWIDGDSKPDAARAVDVARDLDWIADGWTETTRALAKLVIGVYAFGSITTENYAPSWSPDDETNQAEIERALTWAEAGYQHIERDSDGQADEIRPTLHGTILGRALAVAGAPVGDKNEETVTGLPEWVDDAPMPLKMDFALLFVRGRGIEHAGKDTRRIITGRGEQYHEDVARLIREAARAPVNVTERGVTVSAEAVRELGLA